ncbi:Major facilitator superfamily domain containing protein [Rhypophila decipiens]
MSPTTTNTVPLHQLRIVDPLSSSSSSDARNKSDFAFSSPDDSRDVTDEESPRDSRLPSHEFHQLPPVDSGKDAWLFLAACFVLECLVWGVPFSFGVFQNYYDTHDPFMGSSDIAVIGTCSMGIMYLDTPLIMGLLRRFPRQGRWSPIFGLVIMCLGIALSSFSTTVTHLIVTQGILYAIGGSIAYSPCIVYLDEWFVKRKGLAYGIMWSGTGLAGVVLPLLLEYLLDKYGFKTTLRLWSGLVFVLTAPLAWFIKPRLPHSSSSKSCSPQAAPRYNPLALRFLLSKKFTLYQLANVVEALGFFLPGIYLPSYARSTLGASPFPSALTVLLVNVASVVGCVAMGWLIDRLHVTTCILVSTVGATLGSFLLWGFSTNLPVLYVFCVVYGVFAGSFTSAWPGIMREMTKGPEHNTQNNNTKEANGVIDANDHHSSSSGGGEEYGNKVDPIMVFAFLALGRGVGNVVSGPLSEVLVRGGSPWKGQALGGYGSGYGSLIAFTGATAFFGGASYVWKKLGWLN